MSFESFVSRILAEFGMDAKVRNDREKGLFTAKCGEWRVSMNPSGKRIRYYNVRSKVNAFVEI